jgi:Beta-lactamase enzyme family
MPYGRLDADRTFGGMMGRRLVTVLLTTATLVICTAGTAEDPDDLLAEQVRQAVEARDFKDVVDLTPPDLAAGLAYSRGGAAEKYDSPDRQRVGAAAPKPLHQTPNLDVAVIELDDFGRPLAMADVLLSPQHPKGVVVPLDRRTLSTDQVRYRWWDDTEWDVNGGRGTRDVLPGREKAPIDFSSPYPASVLKLMVGFGVLRLVDQGRVALDADYAYEPVTPNPACGGAQAKKVRQFFDEMITKSQNESTCALVKLLHDLRFVDELNRTFATLGMPTLMLTGTNPGNGGRWIGSNMGGIDTAKLLLLVNGGYGVLWTTPEGRPVTRDELSTSSRRFFARTLGDQGHNEMLSTTNWCGRDYPVQGIPQVTPSRWVETDGTMAVGDAVYGQDVRPCDAVAEVDYAHKTGWVDTAGSDAGVVRSLPGKEKRNYVVVVFGNLGTDYVDHGRPADPPGLSPVLYTQKYAELGRAIDGIVANLR